MAAIHKFLSHLLGSVILAIILLQASVNAKDKCHWECPPKDGNGWDSITIKPEISKLMIPTIGNGKYVCRYKNPDSTVLKDNVHNCRYQSMNHELSELLSKQEDFCPQKLEEICDKAKK
ncbi:hypothetical protein FRC03_009892 [Tulasnella sp. 419]|nr:hypothetical protein FRC03_009892 [Tulasnella sp. 419]